MAGVLETAWQPGRSTHGGHVEFKVTLYWRLGVHAAVLGSVRSGYAAVLGNGTVGEQQGCMAVLGCPPDPSNNSRGAWGHPLAPLTN